MFDLSKIADQIGEKLKPTFEATKKQAELSLLVSTATQIYCAYTMRGGNVQVSNCIQTAKAIIDDAKEKI